MKTIYEIVSQENKLYEEKVELEYNNKRREFEDKIIFFENKIRNGKKLIDKRENDIKELEKEVKRLNNYKNGHAVRVVISLIVFLFLFYKVSNWLPSRGLPFARNFWSFIISLIPSVSLYLILEDIYPEIPGDLNSTRDLIKRIKIQVEETFSDLQSNEHELKTLKLNPPKISKVKNEFNSKDFFNEIKPTVLQGY